MNNTAIKVEGLGKKYNIGKSRSGDLRETIGNFFRKKSEEGKSQSNGSTHENEFWALKDVSFEIPQGEALGVIGRNGAGKSTLLKILSKITRPTTGRVELNGRVSSLLEVGTGFHSELTGRENVYLNGTILGMKRKEVKTKFDKIIDFSGVEKFIDTPIKHYSSGMKVRLAFSVAAHLEPEILLIDEVLAVGDVEFQKKCIGKMEDVTKEGRTVIFISHNMEAVSKLCTRALVLNNGRAELNVDDINEGINYYLNLYNKTNASSESALSNCWSENEFFKAERLSLKDDSDVELSPIIHAEQEISVCIEGTLLKDEPALNIGYALYSESTMIYWTWFQNSFKLTDKIKVNDKFNLVSKIPSNFLTQGNYKIELISVLHNIKTIHPHGMGPFLEFEIDGAQNKLIVNPDFKWQLQ